jgi:hypothetical protein
MKITSNEKSRFYKSWYEKGIVYLEHLFDFRINQFYTFENFKTIYQIPDEVYLKYQILIRNIYSYVITGINLDNVNINTPNKNILTSFIETNETNKYLYEHQLKQDNIIKHIAENKWENIFENENICREKTYQNILSTTIDTKIRYFQQISTQNNCYKQKSLTTKPFFFESL